MKNFLIKVKEWIKKSALANFAFLGGAFAAKIFLGSQLLFGAGIGIFVYLNFNIISKLIRTSVADLLGSEEETE